MANCFRPLLFVSVLFAVSCSASAVKCYRCTSTSKGECESNQTVTDCPTKLICGELAFIQGKDGVTFGSTYMKNCLPPSFSCQSTNTSGLIRNCSVLFCASDYCNGDVPTTTRTVKSVNSTTIQEEETTLQATNTTPNKGERNQAPSARLPSNISAFFVPLLLLYMSFLNYS